MAHACTAPVARGHPCAARCHSDGYDQTITKAEPLENQLVDWLRDFQAIQHGRHQVVPKAGATGLKPATSNSDPRFHPKR